MHSGRQGHQKTIYEQTGRSVGRPKMQWLDDVEEDFRRMRISDWRVKAQRRDEWKSVSREVKVLQGL
jgi:hypothetical protein